MPVDTEQQIKDSSVHSFHARFQFAVHPDALQHIVLLTEVTSAIKKFAFRRLDRICFGVRNDGHLPKPRG